MREWDAVIIGAGPNGLVAGGLLARAGLSVLILERADSVGGALATEEFAPGFRVDVGTHRLGHIPRRVVAELELERFGFEPIRPDPCAVVPGPEGTPLVLWRDPGASARELRRFSERDAERWPAFVELLWTVADFLRVVNGSAPPRLPRGGAGDLVTLVRLGARLRGHGRRTMMEILRVLPMTAEELLSEWFESEIVRGAVAAAALTGIPRGPMAAGTAYMLFHHHAGAPKGVVRPLVRCRGGMSALAGALRDAARAAGAEIRTGAEVSRILVEGGRAIGVALEDGEQMGARRVISSADPATTFLKLVDPLLLEPEFVRDVKRIRRRGCVAKVHLAVDGLPEFRLASPLPHLGAAISISPTLLYLERAADAAKYGRVSEEPYLEAVLPSVSDPGLAPPGKHVISVLAQWAPYRLAEGRWDASRKEQLADRVLETLAVYSPDLPGRVLHRHVFSPVDLERRFALPEGDIYHGEMALDSLFFMRPVPGYSRYRTPVEGLFLCGAGCHPGGGVTGLPARNAAREILAKRSA